MAKKELATIGSKSFEELRAWRGILERKGTTAAFRIYAMETI